MNWLSNVITDGRFASVASSGIIELCVDMIPALDDGFGASDPIPNAIAQPDRLPPPASSSGS